MIRLKTPGDIDKLAQGGAILASVLDALEARIAPGVTGRELDELATKLIREKGCEPAFLNYAPGGHEPFPAALCVSVNEDVVHGLPADTPFQEGSVVGLDLGLIFEKKYYLDSARTVEVGKSPAAARELLKVTKEALNRGIAAVVPGGRVGDIGAAVQSYVEGYRSEVVPEGFGVVRDLVGHGVGFAVHEEPRVPNFGRRGTGEKLMPGLVIAIEPMVSIGDPRVVTGADGWSVATKSGKLAAHFEHTVAVTEKGVRILTQAD